MCLSPLWAAQTKHPEDRAAAAQHSHTASRHKARRRAAARRPQAVAAKPPAPAAPALPVWPVNQKPNPATITWDAHGLQIIANNSSLDQILHEAGNDIGSTVTGLDRDQRVFGTYGPGPARDVLSHLLNGTGYNVLMIGDQGNGAPRRIELSVSQPGGSLPQAAASPGPAGENGAENQSQGPEPEPTPRLLGSPFSNGGPPRTPSQILQEMQQRQLEQIQRLQQHNNQQ